MNNIIINKADAVVREYGVRDPVKLCALMGITQIYADLPDTVSGFYMENGESQAIVINERLDEHFVTPCIAHELGHAVLHKGVNTVFLSDNTNLVVGKYEREADLFAVSLLLDRDDLSRFGDSTEEISLSTGLPLYAVEIWCDCTFRTKVAAC